MEHDNYKIIKFHAIEDCFRITNLIYQRNPLRGLRCLIDQEKGQEIGGPEKKKFSDPPRPPLFFTFFVFSKKWKNGGPPFFGRERGSDTNGS